MEKRKIAVIGGGVAGLSAGIYGQLNNFDTEIFEMHSISGGQCTAWERKGYRFDYCLHWLVGTSNGLFNDIWKETNVLNNQTRVIDHEIHSGIVDETGQEFIIYSDIDRWEKYLLEIAPIDTVSIKKMCNTMRKAARFEPFNTVKSFSDALKSAASFFRMLPALFIVMKYAKKTCKEYFEELNFKDKRLSYFFDNMFGDRNFSAVVFLMMLGWFHKKNAGYLLGGSLYMARRMEERYKLLGGKLNTGKRISKIQVENNKATGVILEDGTVVNCDYVISAADGYSTIYKMLDGKYISKSIKTAYESWDLFTPLIQVSFGIDAKINSNINVKTIIPENKKLGMTDLPNGYSMMNYSFDPTMAPKGKTVIVLRFESSWEIWKDLTEAQYKIEKEKIKVEATKMLEQQYPGIAEKIEVIDVATPQTTARYTGVRKGAYEGFLPSPTSIGKSLKNTLPGLNNFYLAGQWLTPGGGLPPSALSGKTAIKQICKKERLKFSVN
jgi:phytoene dehydrogenase-like protein